MVPVAGSAYTYAYTTLGELVAWIIGWDLILEYAIGSSVVAAGWSNHLDALLTKRAAHSDRPATDLGAWDFDMTAGSSFSRPCPAPTGRFATPGSICPRSSSRR